jgi:hypothetical protein
MSDYPNDPSLKIPELKNTNETKFVEETPDYAKAALSDCADVEKALSKGSIKFGPTYLGKTTKGVDVKILTPYYITHNSIRNYYCFAVSAEGKLLGHRSSCVRLFQDEAMVEGYIALRYKNLGIASIIEMAHIDLMQLLANSLGETGKVTWQITNSNLTDLHALEKKSAGLQVIDDKRIEQDRWQKLYGSGGTVGAKKSDTDLGKNEKVFKSTGINLDSDEIDLNRTSSTTPLDIHSNFVPRTPGIQSRDQKPLKLDELKNILEQIRSFRPTA